MAAAQDRFQEGAIPFGRVRAALKIAGPMRKETGAGCRTRTCDLLITNQLLYQLS